MNKRRILTALMACVMALSLAACKAKPPTAEELVENGWPKDAESLDASVTMSVRAAISPEQLGVSAESLSGSLDMGIVADMRLERDGDLTHSSGDVRIAMFGLTYDTRMEQWTVQSESGTTTYSYDADTDEWSETTGESDAPVDVADTFNLDSGAFRDLAMTETDDEYVVTGVVDMAAVEELGLSEMAESVTGSDVADGAVMNVEMTFDKAVRSLKTLTMNVDTETVSGSDSNGVTFDEFSVVVTINSVNETELTLPAHLGK